MTKTRFVATALVPLIVVLLWTATRVSGQSGTKTGEWRHTGGDAASSKYSPLDQINKDNVKDLQIAWRWKTENFGPRPDYNFQSTPLMIGGVLYVTIGTRRDVVAIDGSTGETLWMYRYDDGVRGARAPNRPLAGRGVAYWSDGTEGRTFHVTSGYRLAALNAKTGSPVSNFGQNGVVDLFDGLDRTPPGEGEIAWSSPPIVVGNIVVVGASMGGNQKKEYIAGYVRGYDARTGKRVWIFHTIPQPGEFGNDTWENDSWSYTGHTGVWGSMSADEELGYVYLPVETPTNDYYGGHRPGSNVFGNSLVCLDAQTGKRIWHFQVTHHDIWDYDLPAAPVLLDVTVNGRRIKAVALVTKQAFTFVFDRVTGQPIWPIEERPVPQSDVPGERTSPTQPFPTKPAAFDRQGLTVDDLIDFTPELKAEAVKIASQYRMGPIFTPPSVIDPNGTKGTFLMPGTIGGANWPGAAADPETGILYVPSVSAARAIALKPGDPKSSQMTYVGGYAGVFGRAIDRDGGPQGLPLVKPPWGRITAIDLNTGDHLWMVVNGETPDFVKNHPALTGVTLPKTGQAGRAGLLVTKTLLFVGEGNNLYSPVPHAGGPMLRAYDKGTGAVVSEFKLPIPQGGNPMTYMINGKQYIVVAVSKLGVPGELIALALPAK